MSDEKKLYTIGAWDIPEDRYHADDICLEPSLSRSFGHQMLTECPLKAYLNSPRLYKDFEPKVPTAAMDFGSLCHNLILGKGAAVDICTKDDWKTDFAKEFRKDSRANHRLPVLEKTHQRGMELREGFLREIKRLGMLADFEAMEKEKVYIFRQDDSYLRSMVDATLVDKPNAMATIFDLKVTGDATPDVCISSLSKKGYDLQWFFQVQAVQSIGRDVGLHVEGRTRHTFLFIEDSYPYLVTPISLSAEFQHLGRSKFGRALSLWKQCMTTGKWPGYSAGVIVAEPKPWDAQREMEAGGMGEPLG
jgi:hypothetical protein